MAMDYVGPQSGLMHMRACTEKGQEWWQGEVYEIVLYAAIYP